MLVCVRVSSFVCLCVCTSVHMCVLANVAAFPQALSLLQKGNVD